MSGLGFGLTGIGFWPGQRVLAGLLVTGGIVLLLWSFWDQGRRIHRSRYHRWAWQRLDRIVLAAGILSVAAWLIAWLAFPDSLAYYPYPPYSPWPIFNPLLALSVVLVAVPGLLMPPAKKTRSIG